MFYEYHQYGSLLSHIVRIIVFIWTWQHVLFQTLRIFNSENCSPKFSALTMNLPTSQTDNAWFWVILGSHSYPGLPINGISSSRALSNLIFAKGLSASTNLTLNLRYLEFSLLNFPQLSKDARDRCRGSLVVVNQPEIGCWKCNTDNKGRGHLKNLFGCFQVPQNGWFIMESL